MTAHRILASAAVALLGASGAAHAQLLVLEPAPAAWATASPTVVLLPGTDRAIVGHGPVIMVPSDAPAGHLPGRHHPLVRTWAVPVAAIPVVQAPLVAAAPVAMPPGMPAALWPQQPRWPAGPGLAPGGFQTGLDVQQARAVAAGTLRRWPGAEVEATYDVGFRTWTVQHRIPQNGNDNGNDAGAAAGGNGGHGGEHGNDPR